MKMYSLGPVLDGVHGAVVAGESDTDKHHGDEEEQSPAQAEPKPVLRKKNKQLKQPFRPT